MSEPVSKLTSTCTPSMYTDIYCVRSSHFTLLMCVFVIYLIPSYILGTLGPYLFFSTIILDTVGHYLYFSWRTTRFLNYRLFFWSSNLTFLLRLIPEGRRESVHCQWDSLLIWQTVAFFSRRHYLFSGGGGGGRPVVTSVTGICICHVFRRGDGLSWWGGGWSLDCKVNRL